MLRKTILSAVFSLVALGLVHGADFSKIPDPLADIKVGQWVSHNSMGGMEQKQTVTNITGSGDDMVVTIKTEILMGDVSIQSEEMEIDVGQARAAQEAAWKADPDVDISDVTVSASGKDYQAVLIQTTEGGITTKIFVSDDIPVNGIVKIESSAMTEPLMQVKAFNK